MNEVTSLTSSIEALKSEEIYSESVVKKIAQIKTDRFSFEDSAFFSMMRMKNQGLAVLAVYPDKLNRTLPY